MRLDFLRSRTAQLAAGLLVLQTVMFYTLSHGEAVPLTQPLAQFPASVGEWVATEEGVIDQDTQDVVRADDYLNRMYTDRRNSASANLYVAYFKTQQTGQAPHSPKNCLPGNGWLATSAGTRELKVAGDAQPIRVNQYIVAKGPTKAVVLYWYQSRGRVVASEYTAKVYVVLDSFRYHRTDTALVRVVVGIANGDEQQASDTAAHFVEAFFNPLLHYLPS